MTGTRPLTVAHQLIAACLGTMVTQILKDARTDTALLMLADALPAAHGDHPQAERLLVAARKVLAAAADSRPGTRAFASVMMEVGPVVADYLYLRACAAHGVVCPQPQPPAETPDTPA